jgi:hypothetical protein
MKKLFLFSIVTALIAGCSNAKTEYSDVLHEKAVIVTLIYSPSEHRTEITETVMDDFNSPLHGTDWNGNKGIKLGEIDGSQIQLTSTTIPEKYGVVLQCQHGTFTVEGSKPKHKILYQKLQRNVGDTVDVLYKEAYSVTYDKNDKSKVLSRQLIDMDFVDAQLIKK